MKRFIGSILVVLLALATAGCVDEYNQKLDELQARLDKMQTLCDRINEELTSLQAIIRVIEQQDMITGLTEIKSGNTVVGYRINFVNYDPVTIYNGSDGKKPLVASKQDPTDGNYYWTVQYGDGPVEWLVDPDGNKMLSNGVLPYLKIRDGNWYYTLDGVNWVLIGKADGDNGDQMFARIDTGSSQYVIITLTNGEVFKIPTYAAYLTLKNDFERINRNIDAQLALINAKMDEMVYITMVNPIYSGKDTIGTYVALSNGTEFSIYDWTAPLTPSIFIKQDVDGKYYWAYSISDMVEDWVYFTDEKVPAYFETIEPPRVDVMLDSDGNYYWTVTWNGQTDILRYRIGTGYTPFAVDSVKRIFSEVTDYTDSLVVVLRQGGTRFVLPKQYTVTITDEQGATVADTLVMRETPEGDERLLRFIANGSGASLTLITQGGFTATEVSQGGNSYIRIKAPGQFVSGVGKIIAIFTFASESSPITVVRTFTINSED